MPRFDGVIGLVGFLIFTFILIDERNNAGRVIKSLADNSASLVKALQAR